MKKITFLLMFSATLAFAQTPTSYTEVTPVNAANNNTGTAVIVNTNNRQPILETYDNLADFNAGLAANCQDPTVLFEDFTAGPGAITTCGPIISSAGDDCFPAGSIEGGFEITSGDPGAPAVVFIPPGAIGNTDPLVGANSFPDFTIINFSPSVYAVAFDVWENEDPQTDIRIFDTTGNLIELITVDTPVNTQTFFGFISDEEVGSVELQGLNDSGELFGQFYFGANCMELSTNDNLASQVSIYPNPATNSIRINTPSGVDVLSVSISDILGKRSAANFSNGQVDISSLSQGVYIVTIETTQGSLVKKLVKK